jgi:hypothetical protein
LQKIMKKRTKTSQGKKMSGKKTFRSQAKPKRANAEMLPGAANGHRQPAQAAPPVRYGQNGVRFDTELRYVVNDPLPIIPGKAKVKLELKSRTDANLVGFGHSHDIAMQGNLFFPTPQPTKAAFDAKLGELEAVLSALENHRLAGTELTNQRNIVRAEFEQLFTQRGDYVQSISEGDAAVITTAGLPVKNGPTPTGILPPPVGLSVDLNGISGVMVIRWQSVSGAKSYMLECADVVNGVTGAWSLLYMGGKYSTRKEGMTVGKVYAFRVAAVGGEGGMSSFCPPVTRAAA